MLKANNLSKIYGKKKVVNSVSIYVNRGEIVGLLGPNGAGKTTTFYMIAGLIKPDNGDIILDDENINSKTMYERAKYGIVYLPQEASIFRDLTVEENIIAILELQKLDKKEILKKAVKIMKELDILRIRKIKGKNVSGGERRRVEIARALVLDPIYMLFDEPFAGIDPIVVSDLQKIIKRLKDKNIGIIISDHNVRETLKICDRAYILNKGEILEEGIPEKIAVSEKAKKIYLGEEFNLSWNRY